MRFGNHTPLVRGIWTNGLGTLASRLLGLVRDVVTAGLLGLGGGAMDALVVALRIPNSFRGLFGEGALAASFLPVLAAERHRDPRAGWRLVSALLVTMTVALGGLVLLAEAVCLAIWWWCGPAGENALLLGLSATLLPNLVMICLAAQVSAVLQGLLEFRLPALVPALLNVCWIAAAWLVAPRFAGDGAAQAYVIAIAVVVSGALQLAVQWPALRRAGFRFELDWRGSLAAMRQIGRGMLPIALGLAVTQINTLVDCLLAFALSAAPDGPRTIAWLGGVRAPLETGAAAAIYYGERFYQLPVGLVGLAIATAVYPLLARHAARGDERRIARDLTAGLRLVWFAALPAGVGLMLVAWPLAELCFVRGAFTEHDAARTATMIACYSSAAWASCAIPVLVRGFYVLGDRLAPARIGMLAVGIDLAVTLALLWPLGERALAISTAVAASVQVGLLAIAISRRCRLDWAELRLAMCKGATATAAMALVVLGLGTIWPAASQTVAQCIRLVGLVGSGGLAYLAACRMLGMRELAVLVAPSGQRLASTAE